MKIKITEYRLAMGAGGGMIFGIIIFLVLYISMTIESGASLATMSAYDSVLFLVIAFGIISIALTSYAGALQKKKKV